MGPDWRKITVTVALLSIMFVPVAAQPADIGGGGGIGGSLFGFLDGLINSPEPINDMRSAIIYAVIPFIGLYAVTRFLTTKAFRIAEANFRGNTDIGRTQMSDMGEKASQLISVSAAALTTILYGGWMFTVSLVLGLIGGLWLLWNTLGAAYMSKHNAGLLSKASSAMSSGGSAAKKQGSKIKDGLGQIQDEIEDIRKEEKEVEKEEKQTEKEEKQGEGLQQIVKEMNVEMQEIEDIVNAIEEVESKLDGILTDIDEIEERVKRQEGKEQQEIQEALRIQEDLENRIKDVKREFNNAARGAKMPTQGSTFPEQFFEENKKEFQDIEDALRMEKE
ncbi:MAG: hypothetical protein ABEK01_04910, partial [Candidatus Nanohaloarchaea archaeon]